MKLFLFFLSVVAVFFLFRPFFHPGFPYTHDGENHLARIEEYFSALKQGQIPPRWAPTLWGGYGYPVFNYNYPLPNMLALPFLVVRIPAETTMKFEEILALLVGAAGVMLFLREELGTEAAVVGVIAYLTAPVLFNDLYVRGAVGEVLAYSVFPHVIFSLKLLSQRVDRWRAVYLFLSLAGLMLAHNIFVLVLLPVSALYGLVTHWNLRFGRSFFSTLVVSFLAVLSSMFFWIPALMEKSLVSIDQSSLIADSINHFPTLAQLLTAPYQFGFSYPTPVDSLSFSLGFLFVFSLFAAIVLFVARKTIKRSRVSLSMLGAFVLTMLLMLPIAKPLWLAVPVLQYLQFPWRLLLLSALLGVFLVALVYAELGKTGRRVFALMLLLAVIGTGRKQVNTYIHFDDDYYKNYQQTTTVLDEDKPRTLLAPSGNMLLQRQIKAEGATTQIGQWNGSRHDYTIDLDTEQYVTEPTTYFPGWEVHVDGVFTPIDESKSQGLISFKVSQGDHHIVTNFTQHTPARLIGNLTTVFAMIGFGVYLWVLGRGGKAATKKSAVPPTQQETVPEEHGTPYEKVRRKRSKKQRH